MVDVLFLVLYKYNSLNLYKNSTRRVMSLSSISDEDTEAQKVLETFPNCSDLSGGAMICPRKSCTKENWVSCSPWEQPLGRPVDSVRKEGQHALDPSTSTTCLHLLPRGLQGLRKKETPLLILFCFTSC